MKNRQHILFSRVWRRALLLLAVLALNGCGGGGGGGTTTSTLNAGVGYFDNVSNSGGADLYSDPSTPTTTVHISDLVGFVKGNQLMLVSPSDNVAWFATITSLSGTSYSADVRIYKDNVPDGTAMLTGTLKSGTSISGTLTGTGYGDGTFSLDYSTDNATQANVANIVRVAPTAIWANTNTTSYSTFFVNSTGVVVNNSGGTGIGTFAFCDLSGTVQAIANSALYQMSITLSSCTTASANGTYSGYLTTTTISSTDTLVVALENSTHQFSMYGDFQ